MNKETIKEMLAGHINRVMNFYTYEVTEEGYIVKNINYIIDRPNGMVYASIIDGVKDYDGYVEERIDAEGKIQEDGSIIWEIKDMEGERTEVYDQHECTTGY